MKHNRVHRKQSRNTASRLFVGIYATGIVYSDRAQEAHRDYQRLAFLSFSTLELKIEKNCPADLAKQIKRDAAKIQARRGERY